MLQLVGRFSSGVASVDLGVMELSVIDGPSGLHVVAYSGTNGGVATYSVGSDGSLSPIDTATISAGWGLRGETDMSVAFLGGTTAILTGIVNGSNLTGWGANLAGAVGGPFTLSLPGGFSGTMLLSDQTSASDPFFVLATATGQLAVYDPGPGMLREITGADPSIVGSHSLAVAEVNGQTLLLSTDATRSSLIVHQYDSATNSVTHRETVAAGDGLAVAYLSDIDVVQLGTQTFVIAAAAGTSSLTVLRLSSDGQLTLTDHVIDSRDTRFAALSAVDTVQVGDQVYVATGGGDDGVTLFRLLPDGTLQALATLENSTAGGLSNVSAIEMVHVGDRLLIFVGGETETGLAVLEWPLGPVGEVIAAAVGTQSVVGTSGGDIITSSAANQALSGGGGDDVLIATTSGTRLTGGTGGDTFVLRDTASQTTITDFQVGVDRLDLTGWSMLRDTSQLTVISRADGITLTFNGRSVTIQSSDGRPLSLADVLPDGLGPARIPVETLTVSPDGGSEPGAGDGAVSPGTPTPPDGDTGSGTGGTGGDTGDSTDGTGGTDDGTTGGTTGGTSTLPAKPEDRPPLADWYSDPAWVDGSTTRKVLDGTDANDTLIGASGNDFLRGHNGNDLFYTGWGTDLVYAGGGNDTIFAAGGNNEIWAGLGDDVIRTRSGDDLIGGGPGNDLITGGDGRNTIWAGAGNDTVLGGANNEQLGGGANDDVLYAFGGDDLVFGGTGNDTILGGDGDDTIWGVGQNDLIVGGNGNDQIASGAGNDHVWGGPGADSFVFYRNFEMTTIRDFSAAEGDEIHLTSWIFGGANPTPAEIIQQYARVTADGVVLDFGPANTVILLDGITSLAGLADHIVII